jgi:hypothetical protein
VSAIDRFIVVAVSVCLIAIMKKVSFTVTNFVRNVHEARTKVATVSHELISLEMAREIINSDVGRCL